MREAEVTCQAWEKVWWMEVPLMLGCLASHGCSCVASSSTFFWFRFTSMCVPTFQLRKAYKGKPVANLCRSVMKSLEITRENREIRKCEMKLRIIHVMLLTCADLEDFQAL